MHTPMCHTSTYTRFTRFLMLGPAETLNTVMFTIFKCHLVRGHFPLPWLFSFPTLFSYGGVFSGSQEEAPEAPAE